MLPPRACRLPLYLFATISITSDSLQSSLTTDTIFDFTALLCLLTIAAINSTTSYAIASRYIVATELP